MTLAFEIPVYHTHAEIVRLIRLAEGKRTVIEIGVWRGGSTAFLASAIHPEGCVYAVDDWSGQPSNPNAVVNHQLAACGRDVIMGQCAAALDPWIDAGRVCLIPKSSKDFLASPLPAQPDFVYLDGDHSYEAVKTEIAAFRPLMAKGGILGGHNYSHADVRRAVDESFPNGVFVDGRVWWVTL